MISRCIDVENAIWTKKHVGMGMAVAFGDPHPCPIIIISGNSRHSPRQFARQFAPAYSEL